MLLAMIIPTIILQKFWMLIYVPSASMAPTLKGGDLLIGSRQFSEIERGDIAVFQMDGASFRRLELYPCPVHPSAVAPAVYTCHQPGGDLASASAVAA